MRNAQARDAIKEAAEISRRRMKMHSIEGRALNSFPTLDPGALRRAIEFCGFQRKALAYDSASPEPRARNASLNFR